MAAVSVLSKSPLCVTVAQNSKFIDAGFAFAAARREAAGPAMKRLGDLVDHASASVNPHGKRHTSTLFQYIDLAEVDEVLGTIMSYRELNGAQVGSNKVRFRHMDVLFAKIRPSIDNKKVALVYQELENGIASTEFIVLRAKPEVDAEYIYAALRSDDFTEAVIRECGGDTGRQRIGPTNLLDIPIPWPDAEQRKDVIEKVRAYMKSLETTMALRQQAVDLSEEVLGPTSMRTAVPRRKRTKKS